MKKFFIKKKKLQSKISVITVVMPVFNTDKIILKRNITSIIEKMLLPFDFILIFDGSDKNLINYILNFIKNKNINKYKLNNFSIYKFKKSVFETTCDKLGINKSKTRYVIEIQADMLMHQKGFDKYLVKAMKKYNDLIALSGRGCLLLKPIYDHYLKSTGTDLKIDNFYKIKVNYLKLLIKNIIKRLKIIFFNFKDYKISCGDVLPSDKKFLKFGIAGQLGELIEFSMKNCGFKNKIYLSEIVMRGPLLIDKLKYDELGGLDNFSFFQGYDEIDLMIRAWKYKKYRCGYVRINFESPLNDGTTRKKKTFKQIKLIKENINRIKENRKKSLLYNSNKFLKNNHPNLEIRYF